MRIALDTNILVYAEGYGDAPRCRRARDLLDALPVRDVIVPAQCLGELFRVLNGKAGLSRQESHACVLAWAELYTTADSTTQAFLLALDLADSHAVQMWDALIIAVASKENCTRLVSEDVPGQSSLAGVKVVNPFEPDGFNDLLKKSGLSSRPGGPDDLLVEPGQH